MLFQSRPRLLFGVDKIIVMIQFLELPRCNLVSFPWAKAAIRIYMEKYYAKKETSIEQLYDLVYTILKQRTSLRNDIVQAFRRYNDFISAEYWNNFYVDHVRF